MTSRWTNEDFPIEFWFDEEDSSIKIDWDENHPLTSAFNNWTEEDFLAMLVKVCKDVLTNVIEDR